MNGASVPMDNQNNTFQEPNRAKISNDEAYNNLKGELVQIIDNLFDPYYIIKNAYLINRSMNETFEIPTKWIYLENSIRERTQDKQLINSALDSAKNVILNKTDNFVNSVRPKISQLKRKIIIENISKEKHEAVRADIYATEEDMRSKILNFYYRASTSTLSILCRDEAYAAQLYETLSTKEYEGEKLNVSLVSESLYQSAQDLLAAKKPRGYPHRQAPAPQMYQQNVFNPYQMPPNYYNNYMPYQYYMPPVATGYGQNYYPNMDYMYQAMPNPMYNQQVPYNNQAPYKKPYNPNYKNDKKPYVKRPRPQTNDNQYGNKLSTKSSSIEVNDSEFPALN
jgi:hypothetical protein